VTKGYGEGAAFVTISCPKWIHALTDFFILPWLNSHIV